MAKIETIHDLKFDEHNFNKHTEEGLELLEKSVREHNFGRSILVDKDNNIIAGNGIVETAKKLDKTKIRVVETTGEELVVVKRTDVDINTKKGREMALADNATSANDLAWDYYELKLAQDEWDVSLEDWNIEDMNDGFEEPDVNEDDFNDDTDDVPKRTKNGDIWQLGEHRLMCGDSTREDQVGKLMGEDLADMIFTDPPYNVEIVGGVSRFAKDKSGGQRIMNDKWSSDEQAGRELWLPAFTNMRTYSKDKCAIYVTMPQGGTHMMMMMMIRDAGWQVKHELIWRKNSLVLGRQDYNYQHEPICYGWNKTHNFVGLGKFAKTSVWDIDRPTKSKEHPTMKPIELVSECLLDNSIKNNIVMDLFGGSGSTLIACEQLKRKCRMMELDPHYCDVIIARWEKLTNKAAVKI